MPTDEEIKTAQEWIEANWERGSLRAFKRAPKAATSLLKSQGLGPFENAAESETAPYRPLPEVQWRHLGIPKGPDGNFFRASPADFSFEVDPQDGSVFASGAHGVGKSHFAAALAKRLGAYWVDASDVAKALQPKSLWHHAKYLVVDDLLRGKLTDVGLSNILDLINKRINNNVYTIVTCDKSLEEIEEIDSALASRLASFDQYKLSGKDRRKE